MTALNPGYRRQEVGEKELQGTGWKENRNWVLGYTGERGRVISFSTDSVQDGISVRYIELENA